MTTNAQSSGNATLNNAGTYQSACSSREIEQAYGNASISRRSTQALIEDGVI